MSGGVDSSVVAGLLASEGYDVVGVTLQLYDHGAAANKKRACCAGQDIHDAKRVAEQLGIAHYVLDYEERFRRAVMEDFAQSYARGETPIPCVLCNERVKFGDLLTLTRELGADALATGHYVRRVSGASGPELHRAQDDSRDQSYFLFATTREQLAMLRFPLGDLPKAKVRDIAAEFGLRNANKPDSQDICFVPQGRYSDVVKRLRTDAAEPGEIIDPEGRVLGTHPGIIHFTVGQRKGLGLAGNEEPLFVLRLDAQTRQVVVGPREQLRTRKIKLAHVNWLGAFHARIDPGTHFTPCGGGRRGRTDGRRECRRPRPGLRVLRRERHARAGWRLDIKDRTRPRRGRIYAISAPLPLCLTEKKPPSYIPRLVAA
jgi:tRNA-specific 2-thiouridylase